MNIRKQAGYLGVGGKRVIGGLGSNTALDAYIRSLGPAGWWRMDQGVTVTGAGISQVDDLSGNARHLLDPGTTRPIYLPYAGTKYLYLPGVAGNYASTPDSAANSITGDIDIRVRVAMDDWTPGAVMEFVAKRRDAANKSYRFNISALGVLTLFWSADGSTELSSAATTATGITDGAAKWIRVTLDCDNGSTQREVKFYTAADSSTEPTSWAQLGSTVTTAGTTSIFNGDAVVEVGGVLLGTADSLKGKIYRAIIKNGIDGTTVVDFNPADADGDGDTSFASSTTGETWTINRSGGLPAYIVGAAGVMGDGSADYLRAAFTSDQPFTDYLVVRPLSWTSGDQLIGGVSANAGAIEQSGSTPAVVLYDGSAVASNTNLALNARAVVCAVHNGANGVLRVNNTTETTGNSGSGNPGGITLFGNNTPAGFANAIAHELVRFHAAHDLATRARIVAGLMARHGVA